VTGKGYDLTRDLYKVPFAVARYRQFGKALERLKESLSFLSHPQPVASIASKHNITMCSFSDQYATKDKLVGIVENPLTDLPNTNRCKHDHQKRMP